jgi:hypothetical protein
MYEKTAKGCGLRKYFMEQDTISVEVEGWDGFVDYWAHEALVDLAVHYMGRYWAPIKIENIAKYHQAPFKTYSDSE